MTSKYNTKPQLGLANPDSDEGGERWEEYIKKPMANVPYSLKEMNICEDIIYCTWSGDEYDEQLDNTFFPPSLFQKPGCSQRINQAIYDRRPEKSLPRKLNWKGT
ncbi:hypothetical protein RB195_005846 [Necator americanus]|uniref:Uncharacterized protein n=1 Tax=Necator americanus TaxID=51031 RepID=A0ABR1BPX1_NECAM